MSNNAIVLFRITAEGLRQDIYDQLGQIGKAENSLEHSYVRLGAMLCAFKAGEYWRDLASMDGVIYPNFDAFMLELRDHFQKGRTQLWSYLGVAEKLLPLVSAEKLDAMGISKALELQRVVKRGQKLTPEAVAEAVAPETTIKQLRASLAEMYQIVDDRPTGTWFDFDGAFFTSEEKKEFEDAVRVTVMLLGLKKEIPAHIQRKEIFLAWAREFLGTHSADVYGNAQ